MNTFAVNVGAMLAGHVEGDVVRRVVFACDEWGADANDSPTCVQGPVILTGQADGWEWNERRVVCLPFDEHGTIERKLLGMPRAEALEELEKYPANHFMPTVRYRIEEAAGERPQPAAETPAAKVETDPPAKETTPAGDTPSA